MTILRTSAKWSPIRNSLITEKVVIAKIATTTKPLDNLTQKVYNIPIAETSAKNISQSVRVRPHYPG